jgi:ATP-dependent helicase/DNAse subunit B
VTLNDWAATEPILADMHENLNAWQSRVRWPIDVRVDALPLLKAEFHDERPFSASELESYAACPFRYFGLHVLGLAEREDEPGRMLYGSLVHRIFEELYTQLRAELGLSATQPLPPLDQAGLQRLIELFNREWEKQGEGTLPAELHALFTSPNGVVDLLKEVLQLVEFGHGNLMNEFLLANASARSVRVGQDDQGRPVQLSGKIDRVDADRSSADRVIITDYKTGKPPDRKHVGTKIADGRMLQLPLYAALLETVRSDLHVVGGLYLHLTERPKSDSLKGKEVIRGVGQAPGADEEVAFSTKEALRLAIDLVSRIRAGCFPLTPHTSGDTAECTAYCTLRHACRQPAGYVAE